MRAVTILPRCGLLLALLATPLRAEQSCHVLPPSDGAPRALAELTYGGDGLFQFTLPGAPYAVFAGTCHLGDAQTVTCDIDCDGGGVTLTRAGAAIEVVFRHMRVESVRLESLGFGLVQWDADGLVTEGRYLLEPAEPGQCAALTTREQPLLLEPGDFHPAVARVEQALVLAGQFTEVPDWSFTAETAAAVQRFQAQTGLPPDGRVDRPFLQLLGVTLGYGYGGC